MDSSSSPERPNLARGEFLAMKLALRAYGRGDGGVKSATQRAVMEEIEERQRTYGRRLNVRAK